MFLTSVKTRGNFSPALNVRSTTEPLSIDFTFVRTNAPPLPGLTCWNSTMRHTEPSSSMCIPFLNWFVLTTSATARQSTRSLRALLAETARSRSLAPRPGRSRPPVGADRLGDDRTVSAADRSTAPPLRDGDEAFGEAGQHLATVLRD